MEENSRISRLLTELLANLLEKEICLPGVLLTITQVECSPDLNLAKIWVSVLPDKFYGTALKELRRHNSFLRKEIAQQTRLRKIPKLKWFIDDREKKISCLTELLKK